MGTRHLFKLSPLTILIAAALAAAPSFADSRGGAPLDVSSELIRSPGVTKRVLGSVKYRVTSRGERRLDATIKIPIPSAIPAVASRKAARAFGSTATLTRVGEVFAECFPAFDRFQTVNGRTVAEYRVDLREAAGGRLALRKGNCFLSGQGVPALPAMVPGDTVIVGTANSVNGSSYLQGTLDAK